MIRGEEEIADPVLAGGERPLYAHALTGLGRRRPGAATGHGGPLGTGTAAVLRAAAG
ncbi:hypothetical protein ACFYPK_09980 [Streptomyces halstedii]|uniref:hypothetical protein n=1 Tax=Streptomyces halstedii TaxID=1944 RepID=UPI0034611258|nr:hypothetical protein OG291_30080 [Streptomyces halstedii]